MRRTERSDRGGGIGSVLASAVVALSVSGPALAAPPTTADSSSSSIYGLLFEQATMWRERNRPDLAAQSLRKILESQPDNTEALFQLGSIELQSQRFEQVRSTIARLRQIDPNDARAAELERAMALGQTDDVALAEARRLAAAGAYRSRDRDVSAGLPGRPAALRSRRRILRDAGGNGRGLGRGADPAQGPGRAQLCDLPDQVRLRPHPHLQRADSPRRHCPACRTGG